MRTLAPVWVPDAARAELAAAPEVEAMRRAVYQRALASKDELFHFTLYEWLLQEGVGQAMLMDVCRRGDHHDAA